jgi:hypothetical protein
LKGLNAPIVRSVPVGQELIKAAYVRAEISQIEKFNAAANTLMASMDICREILTRTPPRSSDSRLAGLQPVRVMASMEAPYDRGSVVEKVRDEVSVY